MFVHGRLASARLASARLVRARLVRARLVRARLALGAGAVATGTIALAVPAAAQGSGLSMTMTASMTGTGMPTPTVMMSTRTRVSSTGQARSDFLPTGADATRPRMPSMGGDSTPPLMQPGTYMIGRKGSDTSYVVDPSQKKIWVTVQNLAELQASTRNARLAMHETYTNVQVSATRLADTTVAGIAVQHWRVVDNHTQKNKILYSTTSTMNKSTFDFYSAPGLDPMGSNSLMLAALTGNGGDTSYQAKHDAAMKQAVVGMPLLMRMQMAMLDEKGKTTSIAMSMVSSDIVRGNPPASVFELPSGYTVIKVPKRTFTPYSPPAGPAVGSARTPSGGGTGAPPAMPGTPGGPPIPGMPPGGVPSVVIPPATVPPGGMPAASTDGIPSSSGGASSTLGSVPATASPGDTAANAATNSVKQKLKNTIHFP